MNYPAVALCNQMLGDLGHRPVILDADEVEINAGDFPVEQDEWDATADLTYQVAIMAVRIRVEQGAAEPLVADVAKVFGFPRRVLFIRPDLAAEIQENRMASEFHQRLVHPPEYPLLGRVCTLQRTPAMPHDQSDEIRG